MTSELVRRHCGLLAEATSTVADPQVRHRGTLGGALSHADPAGDLGAVALAFGATLVVAGLGGRRSVPASEFFVDYLQTALEPTEVLVQVRLPKPADGTSPATDLSGQADYRQHLARVLTRSAVVAAAGIWASARRPYPDSAGRRGRRLGGEVHAARERVHGSCARVRGVEDAAGCAADRPVPARATIERAGGDEVAGRVKVKVGPIMVSYAGTARFVTKDEAAHRFVLQANGRETRGSGTASATVEVRMSEQESDTTVTVITDLDVTGKPAQFGRGVMADVAGKLTDQSPRAWPTGYASRRQPPPGRPEPPRPKHPPGPRRPAPRPPRERHPRSNAPQRRIPPRRRRPGPSTSSARSPCPWRKGPLPRWPAWWSGSSSGRSSAIAAAR